MRYQSKLTPLLLKQQYLIREKEKEIAPLAQALVEIDARIQKEQQKSDSLRSELETGRVLNSSYFFGAHTQQTIDDLQEKKDRLQRILFVKRSEYQKLLKKKEKIEELDKQREIAFMRAMEQKEEKDIEDLYAAGNKPAEDKEG